MCDEQDFVGGATARSRKGSGKAAPDESRSEGRPDERPDLDQVMACLERLFAHGFGEVTVVFHQHKITRIDEKIQKRPHHKED